MVAPELGCHGSHANQSSGKEQTRGGGIDPENACEEKRKCTCDGRTDRQTHNVKVRSGPVQGGTDGWTDSASKCLQSDRWTHKMHLHETLAINLFSKFEEHMSLSGAVSETHRQTG